MQGEPQISSWATERFGKRAASVRGQLAASLIEAAGNAQDAQKSSRSDKRYAYGSTLMARRYEALVDGFRNEPGFQVVRPYGSPHHLVVLDGNLLLPFRYAEDDTTPISEARVSDGRVSALVRELFTRFAPKTTYHQEELDLAFAVDDEEAQLAELAAAHPLLAQLPGDTRLIPVAYAANAQASLLKLYWGEAQLLDDMGRLDWIHCEQIPLLTALPWVAQGLPAAEPDAAARFDRGAEPDLTLVRRPAVERENAMIFPVNSETTDEPPIAADERP
jgi:catechol 2,3-dioxygenase-like lactoylglutathione lyase family enzyme